MSSKRAVKKKNHLGILLEDTVHRAQFYSVLRSKCVTHKLNYEVIHNSVKKTQVFIPEPLLMKAIVYLTYIEAFNIKPV